MDAEEHHRHSSSQRREESPGLWPSIRPPWINCCVSSLFREFSPQRRPACCPLIGGISLGLCRPCEGHGKIMDLWNQRNTGSQNLAMGKVLVSNLGLWAATTKLMRFNKTGGSSRVHSQPIHRLQLFGKKMQLWPGQFSRSLFGSVLIRCTSSLLKITLK